MSLEADVAGRADHDPFGFEQASLQVVGADLVGADLSARVDDTPPRKVCFVVQSEQDLSDLVRVSGHACDLTQLDSVPTRALMNPGKFCSWHN